MRHDLACVGDDKMLLVMCVDGLDPGLAATLGLHMEYEAALTIPKELYYNGSPHTLHIWPSIFTGKISLYPGLADSEMSEFRINIRKWLISHGIRWRREGIIIRRAFNERLGQPRWAVKNPSVDKTILDSCLNSFIWNIPGVSEGFIMGVSDSYLKAQYEIWAFLVRMLPFSNFNVAAVYTHIIDILAHKIRKKEVHDLYKHIFVEAKTQSKKCDVLLISDHGCCPVKGRHTELAYAGANFPFEASTVLDIANVILKKVGGATSLDAEV